MNHKKAFTLIELLVVISIIGALSSVIVPAVQDIRVDASKKAVLRQFNEIENSITYLFLDTGYFPNNNSTLCEPLDEISSTNEFQISDPDSGLVTNGRSWPGWNGPYMTEVPTDPWGNEYYFDDDYRCLEETDGCQGVTDLAGELLTGAVVSCGPNGDLSGGSCAYDEDNIVLVLCKR